MTFPNRAAVVTRDGGRPRNYYQPPDKVIGYPLDGWWGIVEPPAADIVNIMANPSFEDGLTTGYGLITAGSIAASVAAQRRGAYGLSVSPSANVNDGVYGDISENLTAGKGYLYGVDVLGNPGIPYRINFATNTNVNLEPYYSFRGNGRWQRHMVYRIETATAARRVLVRKDNSADVNNFYVDGFLVCATDRADPITYFDGDSVGYVPNRQDFYWNGTPHASTSTMRAFTRAGGRIRGLSQLGFTLLATLGLGLAAPNNVALPLALPGGEQYQDTLATARTFDLVGFIQGIDLRQLVRSHSALSRLLDARRWPIRQPLTLMYEALDECGEAMSELLKIQCSFAGGMEGQRDNHYREDLDLRFRIHVPYIAALDGTQGALLDTANAFVSNYVAERTPDGLWNDMDGGLANAVTGQAIVGPDNRIYYPTTGGIEAWDPASDTWSTIGTAAGGSVLALVFDSLGQLYAVGNFTGMDAVANTNKIARATDSTGTTWQSISASFAGTNVTSVAIRETTETVFFGGDFTNIDGIGSIDIIGYIPSTDTFFTQSGPTQIRSLLYGPDTGIWAFGDNAIWRRFATGGWAIIVTLTSGGTPYASSGAFDGGGRMYFSGLFDTANSVAAVNAAVLNGSTISALGTGLDDEATVVSYGPVTGYIYFGGPFAVAGDLSLFGGAAYWSNNQWLPLNFSSLAAEFTAILETSDGSLYVGTDTSGAAQVAGITTLSNSGSAEAFPIVKYTMDSVLSPGSYVYSLINTTTGDRIQMFFEIQQGETVTIDLTPGNKTMTSDFRGDMASFILPGSNLATFRLVPGANVIAAYVRYLPNISETGLGPIVRAYWTPTYADLDDAIR